MKLIKLLLIPTLLLLSLTISSQKIADVGDFENSTALFEGSVFAKGPVNFLYKYSCVQHIYTKDDLKDIPVGAEITKFILRCKPTDYITDDYTSRVKVYFVETDLEKFTKNEYKWYDWIKVDSANLVCDKEWSINFQEYTANDDEILFNYELINPYKYGGKNIMIMFVQEAPKTIYDNDIFTDFYCFPANVKNKPVRTLYKVDDESTFKTPYPTKCENDALKQVPVMKIEYNSTSGVGEIETVKEYVSVNGRNLTFKNCKNIEIYNTMGKQVATSKGKPISLPISGIYLINTTTLDNINQTIKIIVK